MNNIIPSQPVEYNKQRILTTEQLAKFYGVPPVRITQNFTANKPRFIEGKHFYRLTGEELKRFLSSQIVNYDLRNPKEIRSLYLWTEKGALMHAKILNTDQAWEVHEQLVDGYYRQQAEITRLQRLTKALAAEDRNIMPHRAIDEFDVRLYRLRKAIQANSNPELVAAILSASEQMAIHQETLKRLDDTINYIWNNGEPPPSIEE